MKTQIGFKDFLVSFGMSVLLYAGVAFVAPYFLISSFFNGLHPSLFFTLNYLLQFLIMFVPFYFFVWRRLSLSWADLGFKRPKFWQLVLWVIGTYGLYLLVNLILMLTLGALDVSLPGYGIQDSYVPFFGTDSLGVATAIIFVVFVGPFLEEIFFRSFIYRVFLKIWPRALASVLSASLFALFHMQFQVFIPLLLIGVLMNELYNLSGNLWIVFAFHAMNNAMAFGFMLYLNANPDLLEQLSAFLYNTVTSFTIMPW